MGEGRGEGKHLLQVLPLSPYPFLVSNNLVILLKYGAQT